MATNWQIGRVGSIDTTGKWEDKSVAVHDYWENNETDWGADVAWTFTDSGWPVSSAWTITSATTSRDSD